MSLNNLMTWKGFIYTYALKKFPKYKNSTSNISISTSREIPMGPVLQSWTVQYSSHRPGGTTEHWKHSVV